MSESFEATLVSQLLSLMDGMNDLGASASSPRRTGPRPSTPPSGARALRPRDRDRAPDAEARLHILGIHTRDMPTDPDLDLKR
jgi:transitional endoplasmic reticulum ATPase